VRGRGAGRGAGRGVGPVCGPGPGRGTGVVFGGGAGRGVVLGGGFDDHDGPVPVRVEAAAQHATTAGLMATGAQA
jgi:hypothetical protein